MDSDNTSNNNNQNKNEINNQNENNTNNKSTISKKRKMTEIQMLDPKDKFSIIKEANNLYPRISLTQLLSASPSIRKELEQDVNQE